MFKRLLIYLGLRPASERGGSFLHTVIGMVIVFVAYLVYAKVIQ